MSEPWTVTLVHPVRGARVQSMAVIGRVFEVPVMSDRLGAELYRPTAVNAQARTILAHYERTDWTPELNPGVHPYLSCLRCGSHGGKMSYTDQDAFYPDGCPNCL